MSILPHLLTHPKHHMKPLIHTKPLIKAALTLSVLLLFLQFYQDELVFKRGLIEKGQWWRLFTSNLVHTNYPHLFLNLAGIWISAFLFMDYISPKAYLASVAFLIVSVGLGIYFFSPVLTWYAGISGVLYGIFLVGAYYSILNRDYFTGIPLLTLIPIKIIWDLLHGGSKSSEELIGVPVATEAHLYGMIGAVAIIVFILFKTKLSSHSEAKL